MTKVARDDGNGNGKEESPPPGWRDPEPSLPIEIQAPSQEETPIGVPAAGVIRTYGDHHEGARVADDRFDLGADCPVPPPAVPIADLERFGGRCPHERFFEDATELGEFLGDGSHVDTLAALLCRMACSPEPAAREYAAPSLRLPGETPGEMEERLRDVAEAMVWLVNSARENDLGRAKEALAILRGTNTKGKLLASYVDMVREWVDAQRTWPHMNPHPLAHLGGDPNRSIAKRMLDMLSNYMDGRFRNLAGGNETAALDMIQAGLVQAARDDMERVPVMQLAAELAVDAGAFDLKPDVAKARMYLEKACSVNKTDPGAMRGPLLLK